MSALCVGALVRTSCDTGPYRITELHGPCTCAHILTQINRMWEKELPASEPHFHLTCIWEGAKFPGSNHRYDNSYLNGYREDGTNVWSDDVLFFEGMAQGVTGDLFGAMQ